jgi:hypothetical protein
MHEGVSTRGLRNEENLILRLLLSKNFYVFGAQVSMDYDHSIDFSLSAESHSTSRTES